MSKDIDRPLGQEESPRRGSRRRLTSGGVLLTLFCVAALGASFAIALRSRPFRVPPAITVAKQAAPAKPAAPGMASSHAAAPKPSVPVAETVGPEIIHVTPANQKSPSGIVVQDASTVGRTTRFSHLPDRSLIEQSEMGPLPIRSADGRRPMDAYARPWSGAHGARVAIVIGGLGLSQTGTQYAIKKLPGTITLAFAPQGNSLGRWMQDARQTGHEIVMQVPLEPYDYPSVNPGRNTLTVEASPEQNLRDLHWALSRITNYTGVMNYMGARFVTDEEAMTPVMQDLSRRGLLYLDDGTSARSVAPELALKDGIPFAVCDTTIDTVRDPGEIIKKLDQLEATARAKGFAIGTGSAFQVTVDTVASWVNEAAKRGIEIVPISAVVSDPERG
ncbi:MAG TPA: divergent polysaccharide deacetylase family protein [Rhizobiaceae bacterium]|nr:divergent polysaccharide deacetylase family protein [Rhizobiaceae bacterium]